MSQMTAQKYYMEFTACDTEPHVTGAQAFLLSHEQVQSLDRQTDPG